MTKGENMRALVAAIVLLGLIACGSGQSQVVQDPLSPHGFENFIIYNPDGSQDYLVEDSITSNKDFTNYILFRGQRYEEKKDF